MLRQRLINMWQSSKVTTILMALFLLLGCSWLLAPFVHQASYLNLHFISNYEGIGQPWSWAFRTGDIASAVIYGLLIWRLNLWRKSPTMALLLLAVTVLAAVDSIFPVSCLAMQIHVCLETHSLSSDIHYLESTVSFFVIAAAILFDAVKRRKWPSIGFLIIQILFFVFDKTHSIPGQILAVLQYGYEVALLVWLLYILEAYSFKPITHKLLARPYRLLLAYWVAVSGVLAIMISTVHLHLYGPGFVLYFRDHSHWLAEQTVLIGVLLLYLALQIFRGQRRAAYLLLIIFGFELGKYSLISPQPVLAALYGLTFIWLFMIRKSFVRNIGPITLERRLQELLTVFGGSLVALAIVAATLLSLGRLGHVVHLIDSSTDFLQRQYIHHRHRLPMVHGLFLRQTLEVLILSLIGVSTWIIFRPQYNQQNSRSLAEDRQRAKELLEKLGRSSEDYFKLFPPDKSYFFAPEGDGFIAYKVAKGLSFALGDPIAPTPEAQRELVRSFSNYCLSNGWTVCFLPVDEVSAELYQPEFSLVSIGSSAVIDIEKFSTHTLKDKWWRWKVNQAEKAGLEYKFSLPPHQPKLLDAMRTVSEAWLTKNNRREQTFGLGYFDENYLRDCRLHYVVDQANQIVAFTNEVPTFSDSQVTVDLLRHQPRQNTAMAFLLLSLLGQLHKERYFKTFDLGLVPLAKVDKPYAQLIKTIARSRFSAAGLEQFKNKFRPEWYQQYLAHNGDIFNLATLISGLEAVFRYDPPKK